MDRLDALAAVVRLTDRVVRILGQNPGKFTLQGTNTYLVGENPPYTLVDAGQGRPAYVPFLESALEHGTRDSPTQHVSDIIVSHWHADHVAGLPSVLALLKSLWDARNAPLPFQPPRVHKFPHTPPLPAEFQHAIETVEPGMYAPGPNGSLFHDLRDGQSFPISSASRASFKVIYAPGHTQDSIALSFPSEHALYTADTVLGQGTAVFESLGTYLDSLRSLLSHIDNDTILYPGHGPVVYNGRQVIQAYIDHRMEREAQIVQALQRDSASTWHIVSNIYAAYPPELWEPAAGSVNQHLYKLETDGKVERLGGQGKDTMWKLLG